MKVDNPADDGILNLMIALNDVGVEYLEKYRGRLYLYPWDGFEVRLTKDLKRELIRLKPKLLDYILPRVSLYKPPKGLCHV